MRTVLNKSMGDKIARKDTGMNKDFQKVADRIKALRAEVPKERAEYMVIIKKAQDAKAIAERAKEEAQTEKSFNQACDDLAHAREREAHFQKLLDKIDHVPRMSEGEYTECINAVNAVVVMSADNFRRIAEKAMSELIKAREEYEAITTEADALLNDLDSEANFLQCKYRYREMTFVGLPSKKVEDPKEWKKHAVRYTVGNGYCQSIASDLIAKDVTEDGYSTNARVLAAWKAVEHARNK